MQEIIKVIIVFIFLIFPIYTSSLLYPNNVIINDRIAYFDINLSDNSLNIQSITIKLHNNNLKCLYKFNAIPTISQFFYNTDNDIGDCVIHFPSSNIYGKYYIGIGISDLSDNYINKYLEYYGTTTNDKSEYSKTVNYNIEIIVKKSESEEILYIPWSENYFNTHISIPYSTVYVIHNDNTAVHFIDILFIDSALSDEVFLCYSFTRIPVFDTDIDDINKCIRFNYEKITFILTPTFPDLYFAIYNNNIDDNNSTNSFIYITPKNEINNEIKNLYICHTSFEELVFCEETNPPFLSNKTNFYYSFYIPEQLIGSTLRISCDNCKNISLVYNNFITYNNINFTSVKFPYAGDYIISFTSDKILYSLKVSASMCSQCQNEAICMYSPFSNSEYVSSYYYYSFCSCNTQYSGEFCENKLFSSIELIFSVILLTCSNFFMIPAIIKAYKMKLFSYFFAFILNMVGSFIYHLCDTRTFCFISFRFFYFFDFYTAYLTVILLIIFLIPFLSERDMHFLNFMNAVIVTLLFVGLSSETVYNFVFVIIVCLFSCIYVLFNTFYTSDALSNLSSFKEKFKIFRSLINEQYVAKNLLIAFVLLIFSLVVRLVFSNNRTYYIFHSFWHAFAMLAAYFTMISRKPIDLRDYIHNTEESVSINDLELSNASKPFISSSI